MKRHQTKREKSGDCLEHLRLREKRIYSMVLQA